MAYKIMVIEDEETVRRELKVLLENAMYHVEAPADFSDIVADIVSEAPDLVLLDINLPGCSGYDICTALREKRSVPVIFLTSRTDSMDELTGILKGADDYITKPYQAAILLARIGAVLKRTKGDGRPARLVHQNAELDPAGCYLSYEGKRIELTRTEMKILHQLFLHPGEFVSRMDLVEYLWENQIYIDDNTLSVHMARLREKLRTAGVCEMIETKRGMGYRV